MIRFIASRIGFAALVLLLLSGFVFTLFFVAPGDPARLVAGERATEAQVAMVRENLGLDRPVIEQYFSFLGRSLTGDLGFSYRNQQPVIQLIQNRMPATISLCIGAVIMWLCLGIPIGIMSARYPGSLRDRVGQGFILIGISFPSFVLGMAALYFPISCRDRPDLPCFRPADTSPSSPIPPNGPGTCCCPGSRWH